METIKEGLKGAGMLATVGGLAGGVITILASFLNSDVYAAAGFVARGFYLLVLLLPLTLLLLLVDTDEEALAEKRLPPGEAMKVSLVAAGAGVVFAVLLFLVIATILASFIKQFDVVSFSETLRQDIGWLAFGLILGITLVTAVGVGWRLRNKLAGQKFGNK